MVWHGNCEGLLTASDNENSHEQERETILDTSATQHESLRIQPADLQARLEAGEAATIVDVRNPKPRDRSEIKIRGAVRIDPAELPLDVAWPQDQLLAFY